MAGEQRQGRLVDLAPRGPRAPLEHQHRLEKDAPPVRPCPPLAKSANCDRFRPAERVRVSNRAHMTQIGTLTRPARPGVSLSRVRRLSLVAAVLAVAATGGARRERRRRRRCRRSKGAPWPSMRHDRFNTGRSPIRAKLPRRRPALGLRHRQGRLQHARSSTAHETVYAGSADTNFYALRNGRARWRFKTGEIIDSAGVLGPRRHRHLRLRRRAHLPPARPHRRARSGPIRATRKPAQGQLVNWWEGNVTMGPGGVLYAGNTGGAEYALNPNGRLRWLHPTGNSVWSNAAIGRDGSVYFGSLDLNIYAVNARGRLKWKRGTLGFVTSSPAIGPNGTVYIGSFDGALHALDPKTGARPLVLRDRRPRLRLARARREQRLRRLRRRVGLRLRSARGAALALRHRRHGALLAGARSRAARRRAHPLRRLRQRPALRARRAHRPPPLVLRHHPARPDPRGPQRPQLLARRWGAAASTSAASTGASCSCPTTGACEPRSDPRCNRNPRDAVRPQPDADGLRHARRQHRA